MTRDAHAFPQSRHVTSIAGPCPSCQTDRKVPTWGEENHPFLQRASAPSNRAGEFCGEQVPFHPARDFDFRSQSERIDPLALCKFFNRNVVPAATRSSILCCVSSRFASEFSSV